MSTNQYKHNVMNTANDAEIEVWNIEKIVAELPQVFILHRNKSNGNKSIGIRKNGILPKQTADNMAHSFSKAWDIKRIREEAIRDERAANYILTLSAGTLVLSDGLSEYFDNNLPELLRKGWKIS